MCFTSHQIDPTHPRYQDIKLDPSSHMGYGRKYAALHGIGRYGEAFEAFRVMLSTLERSPHPHISRKPFCLYCTQHTILIRCGQSFVITMSMRLPRFKRWSRRLSATCRVCSSTPLLAISTTKPSKQQHSRNSRSTTSCGLR